MLPGLEMLGCQNLAAPVAVMRHVVNVESGANPFAIGVVGAHLVRQPQNLAEAVATANMLEARGYNYSLGLAQVNRVNFGKYGLDTPAKAFDVCANLTAGSRILADCFRSAGGRAGDWGKAFSCYYSGNFTTGFAQGYVQKVYDSIAREAGQGARPAPVAAIPLASPGPGTSGAPTNGPGVAVSQAVARQGVHAVTSAADRIAQRSVPLGTATSATTPAPAAAGASDAMAATVRSAPVAHPSPTDARAGAKAATPSVFEPQVRGPRDRPSAAAGADPADRRQSASDSAFVF